MLIDFLYNNHDLVILLQFSTLLFCKYLFLILTLSIIYHWMILENECILSYYFKKNNNKKYVLGSTAKTTDLKRSFLFATCLSIFMYLVTSYLLYKYTHNKILILLFSIVYLSSIECSLNNKLHNSIFNNLYILFLIIIFINLAKESNKFFYIILFFAFFFILLIYQSYLKTNDKDLLNGLNYYLLLIIILIIFKIKN